MNKLISKNLFWIKFSSLLFVLLLARLTFGWTSPTANPPGGGGAISAGSDAPANSIYIKSDGNVGIGTVSPGAKLEVAGQVKITGGTPGAGEVLTSDATGLATWEAPSSVPSGFVGFFDLASCPSGWAELAAAQGRYLVG